MNEGKNSPVIIVGAGIAGAATAYFLTRKGVRNVLLLEKEAVAGLHSTGRNAAILRSVIPDRALYALASESKGFLLRPPRGFAEAPLVNTVGLYIAAPEDQVKVLQGWAEAAQWGDGIEEAGSEQLYSRIPCLAPGIARVLYGADEGVVDVDALHQGFLRAARNAGAELRLNCRALRIHAEDGRIAAVDTTEGRLETGRVVLAAGAWGDELAAAAGYPLPLAPRRRHLMVTSPLTEVDPAWPVVWIMGDEFYFRPESGGLLLSSCDTAGVKPEQGENVDPEVAGQIASKAARWLPTLAHAGAARLWAGMRTFSPDQHFVVGPDPRVSGLFWVAGLGGHGITCSAAVGSIAADHIVHGHSSHPAAPVLAPARFFRP